MSDHGCVKCREQGVEATIEAVTEHDGSVMVNAADVVAYLHHVADHFGYGHQGGSYTLRRGAWLSLTHAADHLQSAYIDACADEVLDNWRPIP